MLSPDKKIDLRRVAKAAIQHLSDAGTLDFEYTTPIGETDVTSQLFTAYFDGLEPANLSAFVAKAQVCGINQGIHVLASLLEQNHCPEYTIHIPESQKAIYGVFSTKAITLNFYTDILDIVLAVGDVLIVDSAKISEQLTPSMIAKINHFQVIVATVADQLDIGSRDPTSVKDVKTLFNAGLWSITTVLAKIETFVLITDESAMLGFEGLKTGHIYVRFDSEEFARDYDSALSSINRLTISTPPKLGADVLRVLLNDQALSGQLVRAYFN